MKQSLFSFSSLLLLGTLLILPGHGQQPGVGGSSFQKNDITYSTEVVTPHIEWATKLPGGPIKSFFIPSIQYGRDMVELMQRLQLAPTTDSIDREWDINCWGIGDFYGHEFRGDKDDFQIVYNYVEKDLTGDVPFEVMVIPGLNGWSRMTRPARDAILRRVKDGAGLVLLHPFVGDVKGHPFKGDEPVGDERIWELSPLVGVPNDAVNERGYPERNQDALAKGKWEVAKQHFLTEGLALDLLPEGNDGGSFYKYKPNGDVLIKSGDYPIVASKNYGKGRVIALAYVDEGFTPQSIKPVETKIYWDYWEYQYSLFARAILWAAGREPVLHISSLSAENADRVNVKLTLDSDRPRSVEIELKSKNEFAGQLGSQHLTKDLKKGKNSIEIAPAVPANGWPGGRQIFDVIVRESHDGATLNWGSTSLQIPKRAMMTLAKPSVDVYKRGETLSTVLRAAGDLSGLQMRMQITDDVGRVLGIVSKPARGERTFTYPLTDFLGKLAIVTADLVDDRGTVIDQLQSKPVMVVQDTRRIHEYTALVSFGGTKHYLQDAQMRMVRGVAADTGFTWGGDVDNSLNVPRGTFGVYWYDRGPTSADSLEKAIKEYERTGDFEALGYLTKKELFKRTGDRKFLQRTPSFNDPVFMRTLGDIVRAVARNKARYNMDYYFVGDEGSLTSYGDEVDFDWSPQTLKEFRLWLQHEYGTLLALNKEWQTAFSTWNEVVPFTTDEAHKSGNFAPWADHRTFMEITFARAYQTARDAVLEGDRDGHIAVSGTQATNAYDGADWARLDRVIDDFISYDGGNQWDMHRSFAKPNAMLGFWTGYGSHGLAVQNAIWSAAIQNVLHPNIFWMYSFLDPDLTYSKSARDMGTAFKSLKFEGIGQLLMESERLHDGIAIHYSMPSVHAASILGYHKRSRDDDDEAPIRTGLSYPANRDGWVRSIKDLGMQFNFISADQMQQGQLTPGKFKVLVMPFSSALSNEEIRDVEAFAQAGGVVIADGATGIMDEHCAWHQSAAVNDFFGINASTPSKRGSLNSFTGDVSVTAEGARWGLAAKDLNGIAAAEVNIKAASGIPLIRIANTDAVIVRRVGKGWAIYLNTFLHDYSKQRAEKFGGQNYRSLIAAVLAHTGVEPAVRVLGADDKRLPQAQVVRYRFGGAEILAIVKDNVVVEGIVQRDGVTIYNDAALGQIARQDISIRLPGKFYVTDVRTGKRLGYTDLVHSSVVIGDALVLGLSPHDNKISISGPGNAALGDHVKFKIDSSTSGPRLIRCHVFAPDGALLAVYARNVLLNSSTASFVLPSALNDSAGVYTVSVTDVVTGAGANTKITLK
ncbi:MAG TPA: beta-galactosidase trimerization domain-containing protein [Pyrinomonadaceae bacterium]|nr:beta-galactosidase trimerization domain-containing protein [Pyrinomonadaceae bacterium]